MLLYALDTARFSLTLSAFIIKRKELQFLKLHLIRWNEIWNEALSILFFTHWVKSWLWSLFRYTECGKHHYWSESISLDSAEKTQPDKGCSENCAPNIHLSMQFIYGLWHLFSRILCCYVSFGNALTSNTDVCCQCQRFSATLNSSLSKGYLFLVMW